MKNIIELSMRRPARVVRMTLIVGSFKSTFHSKHLEFSVTSKYVEIPCNNNRFFYIFNHQMKLLKLAFAMAKLQRRVYKKN